MDDDIKALWESGLVEDAGFLVKPDGNITDAKVEKAWNDKLVRRAKELLALGRRVPVKLYLSLRRPTEASLQFIRRLSDSNSSCCSDHSLGPPGTVKTRRHRLSPHPVPR